MKKIGRGGILMEIKKIGIVIGTVVILLGATVVFSEPGSHSDPLVTSGYVDMKIEQLKSYINEKLSGIDGNFNEEGSWQVVEVAADKSLVCKDGTEIILRSGKGEAISKITTIFENGIEETIDNGLTDVTDGKDLKMGANIPQDHLLIVPRDDGRGVYCVSNSFFLVKGDYEIK